MAGAPKGLRSTVLSLAEAMRHAQRLAVPRFQRPYSWTESEVGRLIEDLREALGRGADYYFVGTLVFIRDALVAEIVDGQQRIATFTMLLAALRDRLEGDTADALGALIESPDGAPRLGLRPADADFFRERVQAPGASLVAIGADEVETLTDPQAAMARALETIGFAVGEIAETPGELDRFARFIIERVTVNLLETDDRAGAPALFLVINDTRADLSAADLVKAALFERARLSDEAEKEAARRWDGLLDVMGLKGLDELLSFMPAIARGEPAQYPSEYGVLRRGFLDHVDAAQFLQEDIHRYANALLAIRRADVDAGAASAEINRRIKCMQLLKTRLWLGPAVAAVADASMAPEHLARYMAGVERLVYACHLSIVKPHRHVARFSEVLKARADGRDLFGPGGALELSKSEKRRLVERLNQPFAQEQPKRRLMVLRVNAAMGEALASGDDATVEHILPENPNEYWRRLFPDPQKRRLWTNMLGNLTLLTDEQNHQAGDKPFLEKRKIYFDHRRAPIRAVTRPLKPLNEWTPATFIERNEILVRTLAVDWGLEP